MANHGSLDTRFALLGNSVSDYPSRRQRCRIEGRTASFTPALTRHLEIRHFENQILRLCLRMTRVRFRAEKSSVVG